MKQVQQVVDEVLTEVPQTAYLMSVELGQRYDDLKRVRGSLLFAGSLVLLIALIGLLAYLRDEVNRRRRELAIRTIFGASASTLLKLFLRRLLYILLPSLLLGLLLSYIVSERILQLFATRISLSVWLLGGMALAVGLLACLFSGYLVLKAIRLNPRENLTAE